MLAPGIGDVLECTIDGPDENETLNKLKLFFEDNFGFDE